MSPETKTCQSCKTAFRIEPEDFKFYEKIQVPAQTFCPTCRWQRQMLWRNMRMLYKHPCNAPGHNEELVSVFSPDKPYTVYDHAYWWSDAWDAIQFGRAYDWNKSFFAQMGELIRAVPWPNVVNTNTTNSEYCHSVLNMKNCYLIFAAEGSENCAYGYQVDRSKDCLDCDKSTRNELCYEAFSCTGCYRVRYGAFSSECSDCTFIIDCQNCSDCYGCVGLCGKSNYIFNKPYSREEYHKQIVQFNLGSHAGREQARKEWKQFRLKRPYRFARNINCEDVIGDNLRRAKNCYWCFDAIGEDIQDCRYVVHPYGKSVRDSHSIFTLSLAEACYESISIRMCQNILFSKKIWTGHDIQYSYNCYDCVNLFGCAGLRNKRYCILNRQYAKDEYDSLMPKIIAHMDTMSYTDRGGRIYKYGEFFPPDLSPFAYNETVAHAYMPMTKDEVHARGWVWKDMEAKHFAITKRAESLPELIGDASDTITHELIECAHAGTCNEACTYAYRIMPTELKFYREMNVPLPRLCPNCRHYARMRLMNPLYLWERMCGCAGAKDHLHGAAVCPNKFMTAYAPDRPEIVYCEPCYQSEVA